MFKNSKLGLSVLMLLMLAGILAACGGGNDVNQGSNGGNNPQPSPTATATETATETATNSQIWTVKHELGVQDFSAVPKKIVVLDTYLLDIATGLGIDPIGVASESLEKEQLPEHLKPLVKYDFTWVGARTEPSLELIASLKPDLIVADLNRHKEAYGELQKLAPTLVVTGSGAEDWQNIITLLGDALQMQDKAKIAIAAYESKLAAGKKALSDAGMIGKKVAPITLYPDQKVRIYTADSYTGNLLAELGLVLPYKAEGKPYEEIQAEALLNVEADEYILLQSPVYTKDIDGASYPIFKDLEQVKLGNAQTVSMESWAFYRGPIAAELIIDETVKLFGQVK